MLQIKDKAQQLEITQLFLSLCQEVWGMGTNKNKRNRQEMRHIKINLKNQT